MSETSHEHKNLCQNVNHSGESFSSSQTLHNVSQQNTHKQQRNSIKTPALWPGVSTDVKLLNACLMLKIQQASKLSSYPVNYPAVTKALNIHWC